MMIDLIQRLGYPSLLVGRTRLGTLNHTLLSLEAIEKRGIKTVGIVLSRTEPNPGPEEDFTPGDLAKLLKEISVAVLPYLESETRKSPHEIARIMARVWAPDLVAGWLEGPK
jgi:dethiobiotin synthetase